MTATDMLRWRTIEMRRRVDTARRRIAEHLDQWAPVVVMCSGGKDGMVLAALVHDVDRTVPVVWSDDEAEVPETLTVVDEMAARWPVWRAHALSSHDEGRFVAWAPGRPWLREPTPGSVHVPDTDCGTWLRAQGLHSLLGTRGAENSIRRRRGWHGPGWSSPLHDWPDDAVWAATAGMDLPVWGGYARLAAAGWPRQRCKTVPLVHTLDGRYGPWGTIWPEQTGALRRLLAKRQQPPASRS